MILEDSQRFYAEEIRACGNIRSEALIDAFARVPRERFLGPGPWNISAADVMAPSLKYRLTPDADPKHVYHNVAIALDAARNLNNGHPSSLAAWLDALDLAPGNRVFHMGCGAGYYTAIIAETVGLLGRVVAAEVDPDLAARARENLAYLDNVEVIAGDGAACDPGLCDVIFINAGVTHPLPQWLDPLQPAGRLLVPLTFSMGASLGKGGCLLVKRECDSYSARFVSYVAIYSATTARDSELNGALMKAFQAGTMPKVQSLRRDAHEQDDRCWLHGVGFCLSTAASREIHSVVDGNAAAPAG